MRSAGKLYRDAFTVHACPVDRSNGRFGLVRGAHQHKAEATRLNGAGMVDDVGMHHLSNLSAQRDKHGGEEGGERASP